MGTKQKLLVCECVRVCVCEGAVCVAPSQVSKTVQSAIISSV